MGGNNILLMGHECYHNQFMLTKDNMHVLVSLVLIHHDAIWRITAFPHSLGTLFCNLLMLSFKKKETFGSQFKFSLINCILTDFRRLNIIGVAPNATSKADFMCVCLPSLGCSSLMWIKYNLGLEVE